MHARDKLLWRDDLKQIDEHRLAVFAARMVGTNSAPAVINELMSGIIWPLAQLLGEVFGVLASKPPVVSDIRRNGPHGFLSAFFDKHLHPISLNSGQEASVAGALMRIAANPIFSFVSMPISLVPRP